jgi:ABC-type proline/glycine betaine transport system substrate-binding protein
VPFVPTQTLIEILIQREDNENKGLKKRPKSATGGINTGEADEMQWRVVDGKVYLTWSTNAEPSNAGFIVERKMASASDFEEITSFRENSELVSKGASGGK